MINHHRTYIAEIQRTLDLLPWSLIEEVVEALHNARLNGRQIFIMGNGGSAATASHFACDLGKNIVVPHLPRLRVQSLTDNMAFFSACANDYGYESVFAEQLANLLQPGDLVIAISASGNSANVLRAIEFAQRCDAFTIGWSGYEGGQLARLADLALVVPNHCIEQIEDVHLILGHMVTVALRQRADALAVATNTQVNHTLFKELNLAVTSG
jgi:D-sedoheptulose 7-phosphate isomerase